MGKGVVFRGVRAAGHVLFPIIIVGDFQFLLQSALVHIHFAIHIFLSQFQWFRIVLAPVITLLTWYFPDRQQLVFVFNGVEINWILFNCTCCCIIINFIDDTETEFIWRTLLNMSQGTANPEQNLQNDVCPGKTQIRLLSPSSLINVSAELKNPWVLGSHTVADRDSAEMQADLSFCLAYMLFCLCWPAAGSRALQARTLVTFIGQWQFNFMCIMTGGGGERLLKVFGQSRSGFYGNQKLPNTYDVEIQSFLQV